MTPHPSMLLNRSMGLGLRLERTDAIAIKRGRVLFCTIDIVSSGFCTVLHYNRKCSTLKFAAFIGQALRDSNRPAPPFANAWIPLSFEAASTLVKIAASPSLA